jgi:glutamyl-tRNA reductase
MQNWASIIKARQDSGQTIKDEWVVISSKDAQSIIDGIKDIRDSKGLNDLKGLIALKALDELPEALKDADIVLTAVDSSKPVVTAAMADAVVNRNVLMVDLGLPRNIDPFYDDCGHGITVADLDDLKLWHRVKTGTLNEVLSRADTIIQAEYKASR